MQSVSKARIDQVDVVSSSDGKSRAEIQIAITLDDGNLDYNIYFIEKYVTNIFETKTVSSWGDWAVLT